MSDVVVTYAKQKIKECAEELAVLRARVAMLEKALSDWTIVAKRAPEAISDGKISGNDDSEEQGNQDASVVQKVPKVQQGSVAHKIALLLNKAPRRTMEIRVIRAALLAENPVLRKVKNMRSLVFTAIKRQPVLFKKMGTGKCRLMTVDYIVESTGQQTEEEVERML